MCSVLYVYGICTCVVTGTRLCVHTGARGGRKVSPLVTLFLIPRGALPEPETSVSASSQQAPGFLQPLPPQDVTGVTTMWDHAWLVSVNAGNSNLGPHSCAANVLSC